jgi:branched-chain amino acid transport system ATP-binding protein
MKMLRAEHISVSYGAHRALEDVSVRVEPGEICVILGANGAGKSTLLKTIAGIVHAAPGAVVTFEDESLNGKPANEIVEAGIALVPQGRGIFGDLTVAENLTLGAYALRARANADARLAEVVSLFPRLGERRGQIVRTMSGGEQQMVAVGRALMSNPTILMLDEPSLGLSPILCTELFRTLKAIGETGVGILLVEQNARQSLAIADRGYLLENGRITGEGRASALSSDAAVQKAYLGVASSVHKAFGETVIATPMAAAPPATNAEGMVARATEIHRSHVNSERKRLINGHAAELFVAHVHSTEPIILSSQASDISRKASEFAARASDILAAHVAQRREAAGLTAVAVHEVSSGGKKSKKDKKKAKKGKK